MLFSEYVMSASDDEKFEKAIVDILNREMGYRNDNNCVTCITSAFSIEDVIRVASIRDRHVVVEFPTYLISNPLFPQSMNTYIILGSPLSIATNIPLPFRTPEAITVRPIYRSIDSLYFRAKDTARKIAIAQGDYKNDEDRLRKIIELVWKLGKVYENTNEESVKENIAYLPEVVDGIAISIEYLLDNIGNYNMAEKAASVSIDVTIKALEVLYDYAKNGVGVKELKELILDLLDMGYSSFFGCMKEYKDNAEFIAEDLIKLITMLGLDKDREIAKLSYLLQEALLILKQKTAM